LKDAAAYQEMVRREHKAAQYLGQFVYGLPELQQRSDEDGLICHGVGCNATVRSGAAAVVKANLIDRARPIVSISNGIVGGGASVNAGSHHPEKSHSVRAYARPGIVTPRSDSRAGVEQRASQHDGVDWCARAGRGTRLRHTGTPRRMCGRLIERLTKTSHLCASEKIKRPPSVPRPQGFWPDRIMRTLDLNLTRGRASVSLAAIDNLMKRCG